MQLRRDHADRADQAQDWVRDRVSVPETWYPAGCLDRDRDPRRPIQGGMQTLAAAPAPGRAPPRLTPIRAPAPVPYLLAVAAGQAPMDQGQGRGPALAPDRVRAPAQVYPNQSRPAASHSRSPRADGSSKPTACAVTRWAGAGEEVRRAAAADSAQEPAVPRAALAVHEAAAVAE
jgi:hypothetical protein